MLRSRSGALPELHDSIALTIPLARKSSKLDEHASLAWSEVFNASARVVRTAVWRCGLEDYCNRAKIRSRLAISRGYGVSDK